MDRRSHDGLEEEEDYDHEDEVFEEDQGEEEEAEVDDYADDESVDQSATPGTKKPVHPGESGKYPLAGGGGKPAPRGNVLAHVAVAGEMEVRTNGEVDVHLHAKDPRMQGNGALNVLGSGPRLGLENGQLAIADADPDPSTPAATILAIEDANEAAAATTKQAELATEQWERKSRDMGVLRGLADLINGVQHLETKQPLLFARIDALEADVRQEADRREAAKNVVAMQAASSALDIVASRVAAETVRDAEKDAEAEIATAKLEVAYDATELVLRRRIRVLEELMKKLKPTKANVETMTASVRLSPAPAPTSLSAQLDQLDPAALAKLSDEARQERVAGAEAKLGLQITAKDAMMEAAAKRKAKDEAAAAEAARRAETQRQITQSMKTAKRLFADTQGKPAGSMAMSIGGPVPAPLGNGEHPLPPTRRGSIRNGMLLGAVAERAARGQ